MKSIIYTSISLNTTKVKQSLYGASVYQQLKNTNEINLKDLKTSTQNPWCRDYMPVKTAKGNNVQFTYKPSYMHDKDGKPFKKYANWFPDSTELHTEVGLHDVKFSDIIIDGGSIELHGNQALVSDRFFNDNGAETLATQSTLFQKLKTTLEVERLIVLPSHPHDFTGHIDGLVRFVDEKTVLINDFAKDWNWIKGDTNKARQKLHGTWLQAFVNGLYNAGYHVETLATAIDYKNGTYNSAFGIYLNFLILEDFIVMPSFGERPENEEAKQKLESLYHKTVICIEASALADQGGIINCVTWNR